MQRVIVLRGAPASGKSTIAKSYRDFNNKVIWLKVDNFKDFFSDDNALNYVNGSAVATLKYLLKEGFSVVMEGVFQNTEAIDQAKIIAKEFNVPIKVFELVVELEELKKRDLIREGVPEGKRLALGNKIIESIFNKLKNNPYSEAIKLDTAKNNLEECKEIINRSF